MTTNKKLDKTILEIIQSTRFEIIDAVDINYELYYTYDILVTRKRVLRSLKRLIRQKKIDVRFTTIDNHIN